MSRHAIAALLFALTVHADVCRHCDPCAASGGIRRERHAAAFVYTTGDLLSRHRLRLACGRQQTIATSMALRLPKRFAYPDVQSSKIESTLVDSLGIRLGAVASFVEEGASVLDIGTDHGYLPIGLIKSGKARHVIAGEVNKLPFLNAQASVAAEDEDIARRIEVRHGDGLAVLNDKGEVDTVTISGIGGVTIARILFGTVFPDSDVRVALHHKGLAQYESVRGAKDKRGEDGFRSVNDLDVQRLVLQPTSGWPSLRRTLLCHGWRIVDEVIHSEAGWLYITMLADKVDGVPSEEACNAVNLAHTLLGPGALMADAAQSEEEAALLTYWITRQRSHYQMRRDGIAKGKALATLQRTAAATLEGGEARRSAEQEPQDSESITHGNPGNLGPQKLEEADHRIDILSDALSQLTRASLN